MTLLRIGLGQDRGADVGRRSARLRGWLLLLASLGGCGGGPYRIATCAFGANETTCTPIAFDAPRDSFFGSFSLVDPNSSTPSCAGTVDLRVDSGTMSWHGIELDHATCAEVGAAIEGNASIGAGQTIDLHFPRANFTFRIDVRPS